MSKHRKSWTLSQKLEIIHYYKQHGMAKTKQEFAISSTSIYKWTEQYESEGEAGLSGSKSIKSSSQLLELKRLRRENDQLKKLVAEKELILRIKEEMLKKSR